MTKISIIVPVYNVEQYLPACLDSILAQTLEDIEVICVDDGSTDQSPAILDDYAKKDSRLRVIHNITQYVRNALLRCKNQQFGSCKIRCDILVGNPAVYL